MPENRSLADDVLEVVPLVMRVIRKELRSQRGPGLSVPEFRSLTFINRTPGVSLGEVAEHLGLEAPTASKLIESLVQRGLLRREDDPQDRRRMRLNLLPKGRTVVDKAYEHTRQLLAARLAHLSVEQRQLVLDGLGILEHAFSGEPIAIAKDKQNV